MEQRDAVQGRKVERSRDRAVEGTCRSCTLPHLYSPSVCAAFAAVDPAPHVPGRIRPAEDWLVPETRSVAPNKVDYMSRYNELERKRAAREPFPIKSVPKLRLCGPIRPAGPIPALDTKLLVTSKVFLLLSESATVSYSVVLRQSPCPPRRRNRPAKVTAEASKVQSPSVHAHMVSMALRDRLVQASLRAHSRRFKPLTITACKPCKPTCVWVSAVVR